MERRHFIKLIAIITAVFPFLKEKAEATNPNIKHALKYDDPYEKRNGPYKMYEDHLPALKQWYEEQRLNELAIHKALLCEDYKHGLICERLS